jgi:hypothetical protein
VEAQTKKKAKAPSQPQPPPAPSPGSQDSRDSYSNSNSGMNTAEHYGSYPPPPGGYPNSYPGGPPQSGGPPAGPPNSSDGRPPSHPGKRALLGLSFDTFATTTHVASSWNHRHVLCQSDSVVDYQFAGIIMQQVKESPIRLGNPFDDGRQQAYHGGQGSPDNSFVVYLSISLSLSHNLAVFVFKNPIIIISDIDCDVFCTLSTLTTELRGRWHRTGKAPVQSKSKQTLKNHSSIDGKLAFLMTICFISPKSNKTNALR